MSDEIIEQVRFILIHETGEASREIHEQIKRLNAKNASKGLLKSGGTIRSAIALGAKSLNQWIARSHEKVSKISTSAEAADLIEEEFEDAIGSCLISINHVVDMASSGSGGLEGESAAAKDARRLWEQEVGSLKRELHIRLYEYRKVIEENTSAPPSGETRKSQNQIRGRNLTAGRLPAEWWDDLWLEIFRQIYLGDLKPKSQADIVRAMQQWLSDHDVETGDSTLKPRARKLYFMLQEIDG